MIVLFKWINEHISNKKNTICTANTHTLKSYNGVSGMGLKIEGGKPWQWFGCGAFEKH